MRAKCLLEGREEGGGEGEEGKRAVYWRPIMPINGNERSRESIKGTIYIKGTWLLAHGVLCLASDEDRTDKEWKRARDLLIARGGPSTRPDDRPCRIQVHFLPFSQAL